MTQNNKDTFHPYGAVIKTSGGDVIFAAGDNVTLTPQGNLITISVAVPQNPVINGQTPWQPPSLADTVAPKNTVYYSTTANKLVFKDAVGTVNALY